MPLSARYSLSRLFVPVAVTHTSFKFFACPIDFSFTSTLFKTITSASLVRSATSSVVEKSYLTTSPSLSYSERSMSSPIVLESKNTIFMFFSSMLYIYSLLIFLVGTSHLQAVMVRRHMVYSSEIYEVSHKMYPDSLLYQSAFYRYRGLMEPCGSSYIYI